MPTMKINAKNAHEASTQILRVVFNSDFAHSGFTRNPYSFVYIFVYFNAETCRFSFDYSQRKQSKDLLKRFTKKVIADEALKIAATKYTFSQIAIGATSRKVISKADFFDIARDHYDWV
jgi:hypothetical protein